MIRAAWMGALAILGLGVHPVAAEPHEPLARFWSTDESTRPNAEPPRHRLHVRPRALTPLASAPAYPAPRRVQPAVAKNAPVLAIFGDAFAASIARGLNDREASGGDAWTVSDQTSEDASLTGSDADDPVRLVDAWVKKAGHVDAAIVLLGRNDDAPLRDAHGARIESGSPAWRSLYGDRVEKLASVFRERHIPLLWVGLPIVRAPDEAQRYAAMNEEIRDRAVKGGAAFIDSWQAFADESGDFTATGPDIDGHTATLRWTNGWNFTRAGAQKLASFVLPDLKRARDRLKATEALSIVPTANPEDFDDALSIDVNAQIRREAGLEVKPAPAPAKPAGPVLMLTAAPVSAHGALLALPALPRAEAPTTEASAVSHPGRADDFAWPRP